MIRRILAILIAVGPLLLTLPRIANAQTQLYSEPRFDCHPHSGLWAASESALNSPAGTAVDESGNIYIADAYNNRVLEETPSAGSYTELTVPTSALASPYGVAVDGGGDIYIADTGNNRVVMEMALAGSYTEFPVPTSSLSYPAAVAVDARLWQLVPRRGRWRPAQAA